MHRGAPKKEPTSWSSVPQPTKRSASRLHAAALFAAGGPDDAPLVVREDVGRHNAVDKLVGALIFAGALPASGHALIVSGRTSFEIVQKAAMAGIPVVAWRVKGNREVIRPWESGLLAAPGDLGARGSPGRNLTAGAVR